MVDMVGYLSGARAVRASDGALGRSPWSPSALAAFLANALAEWR